MVGLPEKEKNVIVMQQFSCLMWNILFGVYDSIERSLTDNPMDAGVVIACGRTLVYVRYIRCLNFNTLAQSSLVVLQAHGLTTDK